MISEELKQAGFTEQEIQKYTFKEAGFSQEEINNYFYKPSLFEKAKQFATAIEEKAIGYFDRPEIIESELPKLQTLKGISTITGKPIEPKISHPLPLEMQPKKIPEIRTLRWEGRELTPEEETSLRKIREARLKKEFPKEYYGGSEQAGEWLSLLTAGLATQGIALPNIASWTLRRMTEGALKGTATFGIDAIVNNIAKYTKGDKTEITPLVKDTLVRTGFGTALGAVFAIPSVVRASNWWRMLNDTERSLVVQTINDLKKAGFRDGEIARMKPEFFKAEFEKRLKPEKPVTVKPEPEIKVEAEKIKAELITKPSIVKPKVEPKPKAEPVTSLAELKENPALADYVTKRPEIHTSEVRAEAQRIKAKPKEAWEMTFKEYQKAIEAGYREGGVIPYHKTKVYQALSEGKPVPPEVLKDYPDLAKLEAPVVEEGLTVKPVEELSPTEFIDILDKGKVTYYTWGDRSFAGDAYITQKTNLDFISKQFPNASVSVKDVNGNRATISMNNYIKLSKEKGFTDRIREVLLLVKGKPEIMHEGFMEGIFEKLKRKVIEGKTGVEAPREVIESIEGVTLTNNSTILKERIPLFQEIIKDNKIRKLVETLNVKEIKIEPPNKFSLSEQANIDVKNRVIKINADARNPKDAILHELGHVEYKNLTVKGKENFKNEILTTTEKYRKESLEGYIKNNKWEEAFADDFAMANSENPTMRRLKSAMEIEAYGPFAPDIAKLKAMKQELEQLNAQLSLEGEVGGELAKPEVTPKPPEPTPTEVAKPVAPEEALINKIDVKTGAEMLIEGKSIKQHIQEGLEAGKDVDTLSTQIREVLKSEMEKDKSILEQDKLKIMRNFEQQLADAYEGKIVVEAKPSIKTPEKEAWQMTFKEYQKAKGKDKYLLKDGKQVTVYEGELNKLKGQILPEGEAPKVGGMRIKKEETSSGGILENEGGFLRIAKEEVFKTSKSHFLRKIRKSIDERLGVITDRLESIDPILKWKVKKHAAVESISIYDDLQKVEKFIKKSEKLPDTIQLKITTLLNNGDYRGAEQILSQHGITKELLEVKPLLNDIYAKAKQAGIDFAYLPDYFPRFVADYEGFRESLGLEVKTNIEKAIKNVSDKLGRGLTDIEKGAIADKVIRGFNVGKIWLAKPRFARERKIAELTEEQTRYYMPFWKSLNLYIKTMNTAIANNKFFGKGNYPTQVDMALKTILGDAYESSHVALESEAGLNASIGNLIEQLRTKGKRIDLQQEIELREMLRAYFHPRYTGKSTQILSDIIYTGTIFNPINALKQLVDLGITTAMRGTYNTIKAAALTLTRLNKIKIKKLGLDTARADYERQGASRFVTNFLSKLSGFTAMDVFGKETHVNAALMRERKLALKNDAGLNQKLQDIFREDAEQVKTDLIKGNKTFDVRTFLHIELSEAHPISKGEVPQMYLEGRGLTKLMYRLRTYQLKQLGIYRQMVLNQIKQGHYIKGAKNFAKLTLALVTLGATVSSMQEFIESGEVTRIDDKVIDALLQIGIINRYNYETLKKEGAGSMLWKQIQPAITSIVDAISKDIADRFFKEKGIINLKKAGGYRTPRHIPIGGKPYYEIYGRGKQQRLESIKKDYNKEIVEAIINKDFVKARELKTEAREKGIKLNFGTITRQVNELKKIKRGKR